MSNLIDVNSTLWNEHIEFEFSFVLRPNIWVAIAVGPRVLNPENIVIHKRELESELMYTLRKESIRKRRYCRRYHTQRCTEASRCGVPTLRQLAEST